MASAPEVQALPDPRIEASPVRRTVHLLVAAAGWVLFLWWWVLVLERTSGVEVVFTLIFLGLSLVTVVLVTSAWVAHNVALFRRKGPRRTVRERIVDPQSDTLGRGLTVIGSRASLEDSPIVRIRVEGDRKVYRSAQAVWDPAAATNGAATREVS